MRLIQSFFIAIILLATATNSSAQTKTVDHFDKIIVSPYIQVKFVQGNEESVTINKIKVDKSKLHIEVNDKTLRVYLEGAKDIPKYEKEYKDGNKQSHPLYPNTSVVATITYTTLNDLSIRGEEDQLCESPINGDEFGLHIYGESSVTFNEMNLHQLNMVMYGESTLEIKSGSIREQQFTCYGEGKINTLAITGNSSHIVAYGEADFKVNVSNSIKITAFGEAKLHYKGDPEIVKGLHFGEMHVEKIN